VNDKSDAQLLRDYAERGSEAAFREIVTRHTDLVHSAALRQVDSSDLAADITQKVFVDLARKAKPVADRLAAEASLAGWLHRATRYAALNHLRDRRRWLANERQAMNQLLTNAESSADWEQIRPVLDEALDSLDDEDREAVLLRYFKNEDLRAVGRALGISDDAAQKRVSRAVERLREFFSKRNITVGVSGLAVLISANAVQCAPVALAATITAAAVLAGTTVTTSTAVATTKVITMTTLQKAIIGAVLTAAVGTGVFEAHQTSQLRDQVQTLQQQQAPLAEQIRQLQRERDEATNRLARVITENAQLESSSNEAELLKLRGEIAVLQNQRNTANQFLEATKRLGFAPAEVREYSPTNFPLNMPTAGIAYMGYSQPEAALETLLWAFRKGNQQVIMETLSSQQGFNNWQKLLNTDSTDQLANQGASFFNKIAWVNLTKKEIISDNEVLFTIFIVPNSGSANGITRQVTVKKIRDKWQVGDLILN
jgi:RNA polymerase sigma factor (sigma-70 family)